jgi:hypothetical protein
VAASVNAAPTANSTTAMAVAASSPWPSDPVAPPRVDASPQKNSHRFTSPMPVASTMPTVSTAMSGVTTQVGRR